MINSLKIGRTLIFYNFTGERYVLTPEFKVLTYIHPVKKSKKDFHPIEFEEMVNEHLKEGWKVINCDSIFLAGVSPQNGIHYWAYLIKE